MMPVDLAEAKRLYVPGVFGYKRVAKELGVSPATIRRLVNPDYAERQRELSNAAKRRRTGTCRRCGGTTRYNGHEEAVSTLCRSCSSDDAAERNRQLRGTGPTNARILKLLAKGPTHWIEISEEVGITPGRSAAAVHRLMRYGLIIRVSRGVYALAKDDDT